MEREHGRADWERLLDLLAPVHDGARATARRLARTATDGDDLFQEALLRAHDKLGALRDEGSFRSWFYAVLLNVHRSRCRQGFWRRFLPLDELGGFRGPAADEGPGLSEMEMRARRVSRALAGLPAVQREAVVLFELEDMPVEEIAALQRVSVSTAKSRIARGRARLRRFYERLGFRTMGDGPVRRKRGAADPEARWRSAPRLAWSGTDGPPPRENHDA
jgi:RNA polymerase sigma-70 factor (ECF subfamily)